jgi:serine protease AprX
MKAMGTYPRTDDLIASYSSKGPSAIDDVVKPDIVAPGNHVVSLLSVGSTLSSAPANAVPLSYYERTTSTAASTHFLMLNGTSMATPVVSGAVADMLQGTPWLTPDQVKARLMKTAYKTFPASSTAVDSVTGQTFVSQYDIFTVGAGYLDVAAALANHDTAASTALSPIAQVNTTTGVAGLVFDPSSTWNKYAWGAQVVWGTAVVNPDFSLWGSQAVWGTNSVPGYQILWGNQGVWAAEMAAATSTTSGNQVSWANCSTSGSQVSWANCSTSGTQVSWANCSTSGTQVSWANCSASGTQVSWANTGSNSDSDTNFTVQQH